jgi:hypothetical protein
MPFRVYLLFNQLMIIKDLILCISLTVKGEKMKIRYIVVTLVFLSALLPVFTSCNSSNIGNYELTQNEKSKLIEHARKFIYTVKLKNISKEDRLFVKNNKPKVHIQYSGKKQGEAKVFWKINETFALRIICTGDLLDKSVNTRLTVMKCMQQ